MDSKAANIISELLVNLSAGWFGAAIIIPINAKPLGKLRLGLLTINIVFGILILVLAYLIRI